MIRFVGTNAQGLPLKRGHVQHSADASVLIPAHSQSSTNLTQGENAGSGSENILHEPSTSENTYEDQTDSEDEGDNSRFIGDLNPEGIFLATSPMATTNTPEDHVGIWLPRKSLEQVRRRLVNAQSPSSPSSTTSDPVLSKLLMPYVQDQCLTQMPSPPDFEHLRRIYIREVHPIFPVLDLTAFESMPPASVSRKVIKQVICLAAAASLRGQMYLRLPQSRELLSARLFSEKLAEAIRIAIDSRIVKDRVVLIQVLTLLSMFTQLSDDRHSSAEFAARAISYVQTVGLHLETSNARKDHMFVTKLFCCVWMLDRLNAAFHGRPVMMHERDVGRDIEGSFRSQPPAFQLLLRTVDLLDKVIGLYRPGPRTEADGLNMTLPTFESLLIESGAVNVPPHVLATIETFYHAIAMLSNRSKSLDETNMSSSSDVRQGLSAQRTISIVGTEYGNQLIMLPVVPYAVSLALRVSYRELRVSKSAYTRTRARKQLLEACSVLRDLGDVFTNSILMVEMAEEIVNEMDKANLSMLAHNQQGPPGIHDSLDGQTAVNDALSTARDLDGATHIGGTYDLRQDQSHLPSSPSLVQTFAEPNIFDFFDPDFDLNAMDAALVNSMDPSFPISLIDFNS